MIDLVEFNRECSSRLSTQQNSPQSPLLVTTGVFAGWSVFLKSARSKDWPVIEPWCGPLSSPAPDIADRYDLALEALSELWSRIESRGKPLMISLDAGKTFSRAFRAGGRIYLRRENAGVLVGIFVGTPSRLKNSSSWKSSPA